ncbi:MAG: GGDEF domain-containing protein [Lachnospiraceae bacterium]|jgi:diguanylate cyclase (GGDEF)-like protein|nr:GGDEF domain-containing protein [Lachnospiraceae bacterium]
MDGITKEARRQGVNLQFYLGVHTSDYYNDAFAFEKDDNADLQCNVIYSYALLGHLDALIIAYGSLCIFLERPDLSRFLKDFEGIPTVLLEDRDSSGRCSSVITDNYGGMRAEVEHLIGVHGCRNFLYLAGPHDNTDADERLAAVRDTLAAHGLPFDDTRLEYGDYSVNVERQAEDLLRAHPDADALVCANDSMAATACEVAGKLGREVGKDLKIVGFDNNIKLAPFLNPPLTTVQQDATEMGAVAVRKAIALCRGEAPSVETDQAKLIIRDSCGCRMSAVRRKKIPTALQAEKVADIERKFEKYRKETWFMPLIGRSMIAQIGRSDEEFYRNAVEKLAVIQARSAYLYLLPKPVLNGSGTEWKCPRELLLTARIRDNISEVSLGDRRARLNMDADSVPEFRKDGCDSICAFPLFSGNRQFGVMYTEIDIDNFIPVYLACMQISSALDFREVNLRQEETARKLEKLNLELHQKNEILSVVSEYDPLTNCLNRRGLVGKFMAHAASHPGAGAVMYAADLDHLKEINDTFGHVEGDFAIISAARLLCAHFSKNALVGRTGGDEFLILSMDDGTDPEAEIREFRKEVDAFNDTTGKPYYVELSIGSCSFMCAPLMPFADLVRHADSILYEAKKGRRSHSLRNVDQ